MKELKVKIVVTKLGMKVLQRRASEEKNMRRAKVPPLWPERYK